MASTSKGIAQILAQDLKNPDFKSRNYEDVQKRYMLFSKNVEKTAEKVDKEWKWFSDSDSKHGIADKYCRRNPSIRREALKDQDFHWKRYGKKTSFEESFFRRGLKECLNENRGWVLKMNAALDHVHLLSYMKAFSDQAHFDLLDRLMSCIKESDGVMSDELKERIKELNDTRQAEQVLAGMNAETNAALSRKRPIKAISEYEKIQLDYMQEAVESHRKFEGDTEQGDQDTEEE